MQSFEEKYMKAISEIEMENIDQEMYFKLNALYIALLLWFECVSSLGGFCNFCNWLLSHLFIMAMYLRPSYC